MEIPKKWFGDINLEKKKQRKKRKSRSKEEPTLCKCLFFWFAIVVFFTFIWPILKAEA